MDTYDIFMLIVLAGAVAFGAWKGLAWQIASIGSLVASYFIALSFSGAIAPLFGDSEPWNRFLAMAVLYAVSSAAIWLLFRMVSGAIDRMKLKEFDRQMGAVAGAAKGVLLCVGITFFAVTLVGDDARGSILGSHSGRVIGEIIERADAVVPTEVHDVIGPYLHRINDTLEGDPLHHEHGHLEDGHGLPELPNIAPDWQQMIPDGTPFQQGTTPPTAPQFQPNYPPQYPPQHQPNFGP